MRIAAVVGNVLLFLFTGILLWTEGPSKGGGHVILTVLMLLVPILSAAAILRWGPRNGRRSGVKSVAAVANVILLGFVGWAIVSSYPYPEGSGVIAFAAMCVVVPTLNLLALLRPGARPKPAT